MKAKAREQREARRLRRSEGLPYKVIAKRLGVSPSSVYAWTRDIAISEEHAARNQERSRVIFVKAWSELNRRKREEFQASGRARAKTDDALHRAGCMLYWAEGGKGRNVVQFCNSDVYMVAFFRRFLVECFDVAPADLKLRLHVYLNGDLSLDEIEGFWLRRLDIPKASLRGHSLNPLPTSSSGSKRNRLPFGVATLYLYRTDIVQHIYGAIHLRSTRIFRSPAGSTDRSENRKGVWSGDCGERPS